MAHDPRRISRFADLFAALGSVPRLLIVRVLLAAHPAGLFAGEIQEELGIPASTLSHHLDKLKADGLVRMKRERQFLRYSANTETLEELVGFLFSECCSRSRAIAPETLIQIARETTK